MTDEDFEHRASRVLIENEGPPALALQLVAMSRQFASEYPRLDWEMRLIDWIRFHRGELWSAAGFQVWASKLIETEETLKKLKEIQSVK